MKKREPHNKIIMSKEDIALAKKMQARGFSYRLISERTGYSGDVLRNHLISDYAERRRRMNAAARQRRSEATGYLVQADESFEPPNPTYDPWRDGPPQYREFYSQLFGDPPIGRSALDRQP